MPIVHGDRIQLYETQARSQLNQAGPVQNTWYDLLPATDNARVYKASVNIEDVNETLECQAIVDGVTIPAVALACNHSTNYYITVKMDAITRTIYMEISATAADSNRVAFILEGLSVQIQVRKTTAAGAGNLTGVCFYGVKAHA